MIVDSTYKDMMGLSPGWGDFDKMQQTADKPGLGSVGWLQEHRAWGQAWTAAQGGAEVRVGRLVAVKEVHPGHRGR